MRTADQMEIEVQRVHTQMRAYEADGCAFMEDYFHLKGVLAGITAAAVMMQRGFSEALIVDAGRRDERAYQSVGVVVADAWQSGFTAGVLWVGEAFDWDDEGRVVERKPTKEGGRA